MANPPTPFGPPPQPSICWPLLISMAAIAAYYLLLYTNYGQILGNYSAYGGLLAAFYAFVPITILILMHFYHNRVINCWFVRKKWGYIAVSFVDATSIGCMVFVWHIGEWSNFAIAIPYVLALGLFGFERLCEEHIDFDFYTAFFNLFFGAGVMMGYVEHRLWPMPGLLVLSFCCLILRSIAAASSLAARTGRGAAAATGGGGTGASAAASVKD